MSRKLVGKFGRWESVDDWRWRLPRSGRMKTDGLVFATTSQMKELEGEQALEQVANVACLPGIVGPSMAMPDIHWGYGFPIGGVAAFDARDGVISPGGVGYDINCGVRLLAVPLKYPEIQSKLRELAGELYHRVPSGVGAARSDLILTDRELERILAEGAARAVELGFGRAEDLEAIEARGQLADASPKAVSRKARDRGRSQLGTLGSGNHFVEVQQVAAVLDPEVAGIWGLDQDQVTVLIHCGSRGLGHQVCDDALDQMLEVARRHGIDLPDPQLACAPLSTAEAQGYWGAMNAAANFAFANRQLITHQVRQAVATLFGEAIAGGTYIVYDVAHNIAKLEEHQVGNRTLKLCVHRKGATRAFPPGHPELASRYRATGQPVLVPGDMGRASYVLVGTEQAAMETFASCCHGAGRRLSRHAAKKVARKRNLPKELEEQGILVRAASRATVDEEMPEAYKDVSEVVETVVGAGLARPVVRLQPRAVIKG